MSITFPKGDLTLGIGLTLLRDGSFVVVGRAETTAGPVSWGWAARVSRDGSMLWERDWKSIGVGSALFDSTVADGGGVIAVGEIVPSGGERPRYPIGLVMKIDELGSLEWMKTFDLGAVTKFTSVVGDGLDGALVGAVVNRAGTEPSFVAKVTASGEIDGVVPVQDDGQWVVRLKRAGLDGYVLVGTELIRLDRAGRPLWRQAGLFRDAAAFHDGGVVALRLGDQEELLRFDPHGGLLWKRSAGTGNKCGALGVCVLGADEIAVVSNSCSESEDVSVTLFSAAGEERGAHKVLVGSGVQALAARIDSAGSVVLAGTTEDRRKGWVFRSGPILARPR